MCRRPGCASPRRCTARDGHERPVTSPAWTAVEVARGLRRPRALATLDAALRSETCGRGELWRAAVEQAGRRGIVAVRELIALADPLAESPMESEARLAMIDGGLPIPTLQHEIVDGNRERRRIDFAWPEQRVAVEYDGVDSRTAILTRCVGTAGAARRWRTWAGWSSPLCSRTSAIGHGSSSPASMRSCVALVRREGALGVHFYRRVGVQTRTLAALREFCSARL